MQHTQAHPAFEYGCRFFAYYYIGEKKKFNRFFKFGRRINLILSGKCPFFPFFGITTANMDRNIF